MENYLTKLKTFIVALSLMIGTPLALRAEAPDSTCAARRDNLTTVRTGVATSFVAGNVYLWHYFKKAWWSGEKAPHLFFHADWDQDFRDQDKFGHMFGGYHLTRVGHDGLKYACVSEKKAQLISAAYALFFQTQIEIFDGHYKKYGFSYA
ncbi:MAG: YfiM family protein, partial [Gemmatimonadota bacterium]|nr:YfiM family protein [Gemmatimonadota bacterium]